MDKDELRDRMRAVGSPLPTDQHRIGEGIFGWLSPRLPGTVSAYLAMSHEVDLEPLFQRLPGWRWVLPRVEADRSLTFRDAAVPRETHRFGMRQPQDRGAVVPVAEIDVFLVPGLAFDLQGRRLGHGGGFYDRLLAQARADAATVGVAPPERILDRVPERRGDVRVGWLATVGGVIACSPTR